MAAGTLEARHARWRPWTPPIPTGRWRSRRRRGSRRRAAARRRGGDLVQRARSARSRRPSARRRSRSCARRRRESGGFPWWPGGPPSPYMTLYILHGFAQRARSSAWTCPRTWSRRLAVRAAPTSARPRVLHAPETLLGVPDVRQLRRVLAIPTRAGTGDAFDAADRKTMLDYSFAHWKEHSPYLKGQLALTLKRGAGRPTRSSCGTASWTPRRPTRTSAPTGRPRTARGSGTTTRSRRRPSRCARSLELAPADARRDGLVQWLFLNKKLNQWKSTRATAEVIYSLVWYLRRKARWPCARRPRSTVGGQTDRRSSSSPTATRASATRSSSPARRSIRDATPRSRSRRPARGSPSRRRPGTSRRRSCPRRSAAISSRSRAATSGARRRRGVRR